MLGGKKIKKKNQGEKFRKKACHELQNPFHPWTTPILHDISCYGCLCKMVYSKPTLILGTYMHFSFFFEKKAFINMQNTNIKASSRQRLCLFACKTHSIWLQIFWLNLLESKSNVFFLSNSAIMWNLANKQRSCLISILQFSNCVYSVWLNCC
jgi:hypothetical protein